MTGFIYAIECSGYIKIGYSGNIARRFSKIQSDNPIQIELLGSWKGTLIDESEIHAAFKSSRVSGDWFRDTSELRSLIAAKREVDTERSPRLVDFCGHWVPRGTEAAIAKVLGVSRACVYRWNLNGIPVHRARAVEKITSIPLHELRPDIWTAA